MKAAYYDQKDATTGKRIKYYHVMFAPHEVQAVKGMLGGERFDIRETSQGFEVFASRDGQMIHNVSGAPYMRLIQSRTQATKNQFATPFGAMEMPNNRLASSKQSLAVTISNLGLQPIRKNARKLGEEKRRKASETVQAALAPQPKVKTAAIKQTPRPVPTVNDNIGEMVEQINQLKDRLGSSVVFSISEKGYLEVLTKYGRD